MRPMSAVKMAMTPRPSAFHSWVVSTMTAKLSSRIKPLLRMGVRMFSFSFIKVVYCRKKERKDIKKFAKKKDHLGKWSFLGGVILRLDNALSEHSFSNAHKAGDVGTLHIVDGTVSLTTVFNAHI